MSKQRRSPSGPLVEEYTFIATVTIPAVTSGQGNGFTVSAPGLEVGDGVWWGRTDAALDVTETGLVANGGYCATANVATLRVGNLSTVNTSAEDASIFVAWLKNPTT